MQQTFKVKMTNLLQEKLEEQGASDESSGMTESKHSVKLFDFLHKTSNNIYRDSAIKIFKSFVHPKPQVQICLCIVKLSE